MQEYYSLIDKAEMFICDKDFERADSVYQKAFLIYDKPSVYDIYNHLMVISELGASNKTLNNLEVLVSKFGLPLDFFHMNEDLNIFKNDTLLWSEFLTNYPNWRRVFIENADLEYAETINLFKEWDQAFRHYDYGKFRPYHKSDSVIYHQLFHLIDKKGYPYNEIVGTRFSDSRPYLRFQSSFPMWINLLHASIGKDTLLRNVLINKWFEDGFLIPEAVSALLAHYFEKIPISGAIHAPTTFIKHEDKIYDQLISEEKESQIDSLRKSFLLCSLKDFKRKLIFQYNNPEFILVPDRHIGIFEGDDPVTQWLIEIGELILISDIE